MPCPAQMLGDLSAIRQTFCSAGILPAILFAHTEIHKRQRDALRLRSGQAGATNTLDE